jgi:hypothetical protein
MRARRIPLSAVFPMSSADLRGCPRRVLETTLGKLIPLIDLFLTAAGRESRPGDFGPGTTISLRTDPLTATVHVRVTCDPEIERALRPLFPCRN